ncbi:glycosyltransferase [Algoriphagus sp. AK58]|uniref:glycosyltransferase n=1 Tax=Algoriphagus sp. AK58 TaxID=1406877 RepID=UPI001650C322|nr:glycosyltransferase [Algoriphagus sp. AK58]MBC6369205.1 hypothetical protein [Algoriphagus sp. AK58]
MVKLALVTTRFVRHGPNKQLLYFIQNIDRKKFTPIIIKISSEVEPSIYNLFNNENVEIINLNLGFFESLFLGRTRLREIVKEKNIEIIHSFTFALRVEFLLYNIKNVIKVATIRNSPLQNNYLNYGGIVGFILTQMQLFYYKKFDILVACSESVYKAKELSKFKKVTIQNGIDINFVPFFSNSFELRKKFGIPVEKKVFITITNGSKIKNNIFLIEYFKNQKDRVLILAGNFSQTEKAAGAGSKNIIFTGHVSNVYEYFKLSDFFVSASFVEGLPNAVLEALLIGKPCLLSNIPMHQEILNHSNFELGKLFTNNDVNDFQVKVLEVEKLSSNSFEGISKNFVESNFSSKRMTTLYENLYNSLIQ